MSTNETPDDRLQRILRTVTRHKRTQDSGADAGEGSVPAKEEQAQPVVHERTPREAKRGNSFAPDASAIRFGLSGTSHRGLLSQPQGQRGMTSPAARQLPKNGTVYSPSIDQTASPFSRSTQETSGHQRATMRRHVDTRRSHQDASASRGQEDQEGQSRAASQRRQASHARSRRSQYASRPSSGQSRRVSSIPDNLKGAPILFIVDGDAQDEIERMCRILGSTQQEAISVPHNSVIAVDSVLRDTLVVKQPDGYNPVFVLPSPRKGSEAMRAADESHWNTIKHLPSLSVVAVEDPTRDDRRSTFVFCTVVNLSNGSDPFAKSIQSGRRS